MVREKELRRKMFKKKKKLDKAKQGRETNFLLSKNVKVSYDTRKTKLGVMNCLTIGASGCGKSDDTFFIENIKPE